MAFFAGRNIAAGHTDPGRRWVEAAAARSTRRTDQIMDQDVALKFLAPGPAGQTGGEAAREPFRGRSRDGP